MSSSASMILRASQIVVAAVFQTFPLLRYATEYLQPEHPKAWQRMPSRTFDGIYVVMIVLLVWPMAQQVLILRLDYINEMIVCVDRHIARCFNFTEYPIKCFRLDKFVYTH